MGTFEGEALKSTVKEKTSTREREGRKRKHEDVKGGKREQLRELVPLLKKYCQIKASPKCCLGLVEKKNCTEWRINLAII